MLLNREVHFRDWVLAGGAVLFCSILNDRLFILLGAVVIMVPVCYLYIFVSRLFLGRNGLALSALFSLFLVALIVVGVLIK